jgi:hypothetical protein
MLDLLETEYCKTLVAVDPFISDLRESKPKFRSELGVDANS